MHLTLAGQADYAEIIDLANWAYRGTGQSTSWNVESGFLAGQRLNESLLRENLAARPHGRLLIYREESDGVLLGTAWLDPRAENVWYLGLFMVRPDRQDEQLGRTLLSAAESFAGERGGRRIRTTVLHVRSALIAWYERRGYRPTGETEPFPYGDDRFGKPLRDDLYFLVFEKDIELCQIPG